MGQLNLALYALALIVFFVSRSAGAMESLVIVTDPWPPYSFVDGDVVTGVDVEITQAVFSSLEIDIVLKTCPWKRCLLMVETREADAILDISVTQERKAFLFFPDEPVSEGITVFFVKEDRHIPFSGLQDLNGLRAGIVLGYSYCEEIDNAPFMKDAEDVLNVEQNFNKLLLGRIDFLIEVDSVGYYVARQAGISDKVKTIANAAYCHGGNYLAFSKKPGHEELAGKFGQALRQFKTTESYQKILRKYGKK